MSTLTGSCSKDWKNWRSGPTTPGRGIGDVDPQPTSIPDHIKRVLNHYAQRDLLYAYACILIAWFRQQGVAIPNGLLSVNPLSGGSGAKPNSDKVRLGTRAIEAHIQLSGEDLSVEALRKAYTQPIRCASEIAKTLLPSEYESNRGGGLGRGRKRDAARKRIEEAIKAVQNVPDKAGREQAVKWVIDDLVEMLLNGTFPMGSKLLKMAVTH
jgi:hypothetical protein